MGNGVIKSYIWTFTNRFLHFVLILSFALSYLFAKLEGFLSLHFFFGILFGVAVLLRIIWGFVGTKYSRFCDFEWRGVFDYFKSILTHKSHHFIGHNPASSIAIVLMLILGLFTVFCGFLQCGAEEGKGVFGFLFYQYSIFEPFGALHKNLANVLLVVVGIHICGSLVDKFLHRGTAIDSMISGYKFTQINVSVSLNRTQRIVSYGFFGFLFLCGVVLLLPKNPILQTIPQDSFIQDSEKYNAEVYRQECGSCHIAYAPYLLPKTAWNLMMEDLENHFGDDASLEEEDHKVIAEFLAHYASDTVDTKFYSVIPKDSQQMAITKYPYWERAHKGLDSKIFKTSAIKSASNCQMCHNDAEKGLFSKEAIFYDKLKGLSP